MKFLFTVLLFPFLAVSQSDTAKGIHFELGLTWQQIKDRARAENKYIFLDCYATWCKPCKEMDMNVYSNDTVGEIMADKFISAKLQMDTSKEDNASIRSRYEDAHNFMQLYRIVGYPTYFFFSPDGRLVHKDMGFKKVNDFLLMVSDATNPEKQYYTILEKYKSGGRDDFQIKYLIKTAREFGEDELANKIARDCIDNLILTLENKNLYTRDNVLLITDFLQHQPQSFKERSFDLFIHHSPQIDSAVATDGWTSDVIDYIILSQEIKPTIDAAKNAGKNPNWNNLKSIIRDRYSAEFIDRNVLRAQVRWYSDQRDVKNITKYLDIVIKKYGKQFPDLLYYLNFNAWNLFLSSNNKSYLERALAWSELSQQMILPDQHPALIDTKANLLYKLGRTKEAIALEEKALALSPEDKNLKAVVEKMKKGEATWQR